MTDKAEIERIARGLSEAQRKAITGARKDGADFRIQRGSGRGLMKAGVTWRSFDGVFLSETGLALRAHLQEENG